MREPDPGSAEVFINGDRIPQRATGRSQSAKIANEFPRRADAPPLADIQRYPINAMN
jgi:hypothetical protein